MSPVGRIRVRVTEDFEDAERRFGGMPNALTRATHDGVRRAGSLLIDALERLDNSSAPWQSSFLRSPTGATFEALSTSDTQAYQEFGTRPHVIRAIRAKALRFYWNKRQDVFFFRSVNHPGQTPKPYVDRAGRFAERGMSEELDRSWRDALDDR